MTRVPVLLAVLVALVLAGCGDDDDTTVDLPAFLELDDLGSVDVTEGVNDITDQAEVKVTVGDASVDLVTLADEVRSRAESAGCTLASSSRGSAPSPGSTDVLTCPGGELEIVEGGADPDVDLVAVYTLG